MVTFVSVCIASDVSLWLYLYQYVSRRKWAYGYICISMYRVGRRPMVTFVSVCIGVGRGPMVTFVSVCIGVGRGPMATFVSVCIGVGR